MYEWYCYALVQYGYDPDIWYDWQAVPDIIRAPSRMLARKLFDKMGMVLLIKGPPIDNFQLEGPPPVIPPEMRKHPQFWPEKPILQSS